MKHVFFLFTIVKTHARASHCGHMPCHIPAKSFGEKLAVTFYSCAEHTYPNDIIIIACRFDHRFLSLFFLTPFHSACLDLLLLFLILGHTKPSLEDLDLSLHPVLFLVKPNSP